MATAPVLTLSLQVALWRLEMIVFATHFPSRCVLSGAAMPATNREQIQRQMPTLPETVVYQSPSHTV